MSVSGGGRLPEAVDAAMAALNTSIHVDRELWRDDIAGSIAHARGLARAGIVAGVLHEHFQVRLFKRVIVVARKGRLHFADLLADVGLVA